MFRYCFSVTIVPFHKGRYESCFYLHNLSVRRLSGEILDDPFRKPFSLAEYCCLPFQIPAETILIRWFNDCIPSPGIFFRGKDVCRCMRDDELARDCSTNDQSACGQSTGNRIGHSRSPRIHESTCKRQVRPSQSCLAASVSVGSLSTLQLLPTIDIVHISQGCTAKRVLPGSLTRQPSTNASRWFADMRSDVSTQQACVFESPIV